MSNVSLATSSHHWKETIYHQVQERNQLQSTNFKELIKQHNLLLLREKTLRERTGALEKEILILRQENADLKKDKPNVSSISSLKVKLSESAEICKRLEGTIRERDSTISILQDEVRALHEKLVRLEDRNKAVEKENEQLVERWMKKISEEATKMNEANVFYEQMVQANQKQAKSLENLNNNNNLSASPPKVVMDQSSLAMLALDHIVVVPTKAKRKLLVHTAEVTSAAFNSSGVTMATGSMDKTVRLWNTLSGNPMAVLSGSVQSIMCVRFSPNDELLVGTSNDNAARLWGVESGRVRHTLTGHVGKVYSAAFTMDSAKIVTGSHDRTLKLWDLHKGYCTRTIFCVSSCNDLILESDANMAASGHLDHHLRIWDMKSGACVQDLAGIHENQITSVALSNDRMTLLTNSRDNTLKLLDVRTFDVRATLRADEYRNGLNWSRACFSPDGMWIAAGSADGSVFIWNALTGKLEKSLSGVHSSAVACCAWSPNGSVLASTGDKDKMVVLWD